MTSISSLSQLRYIQVRLGWNPETGLFLWNNSDLDLSCLVFDSAGERVDYVSVDRSGTDDGAIRRPIENTDGRGEGWDERLEIDLPQITDTARKMFVAVTSRHGRPLRKIDGFRLSMTNTPSDGAEETVIFDAGNTSLTTGQQDDTGLLVGRIFQRGNAGWTLAPIMRTMKAQHYKDAGLLSLVRAYVSC